jgi:hypothetical protein
MRHTNLRYCGLHIKIWLLRPRHCLVPLNRGRCILERLPGYTDNMDRLNYQSGVYAPPKNGTNPAYLEFLSSGDSLTISSTGEVERGRWIKAGPNFQVTSAKGATAVWPQAELQPVTGIPGTDRITVRLLQSLSSRTAKSGMEVKAVSITPALANGSILIPQDSEFSGKIIETHGVGWCIKHESAALTVHFDTAKLPDGRTEAEWLFSTWTNQYRTGEGGIRFWQPLSMVEAFFSSAYSPVGESSTGYFRG